MKSFEERFDEIIESGYADFKDIVEQDLDNLYGDSKIEELMALAFHMKTLTRTSDLIFDFDIYRDQSLHQRGIDLDLNSVKSKFRWDKGVIHIFQHFPVLKYKIDFLCGMKIEEYFFFLAVECDGHEFHEKTKQQVSRDKRRDRDLLLNGIPSVRFSGSDVWRDPYGCIEDVLGYFWMKVDSVYPPFRKKT
jgi:very-short-patch-repair endonuclease